MSNQATDEFGLPKTMDIYSAPGTKVTPAKKDGLLYGGLDYDKEKVVRHLDIDGVYTLEYADVGSWGTTVYFREHAGIGFNSSCFVEVS